MIRVIMVIIMTLIKTSLIVINDSQMCLDLPWKAILYKAFSIKLNNVKYQRMFGQILCG